MWRGLFVMGAGMALWVGLARDAPAQAQTDDGLRQRAEALVAQAESLRADNKTAPALAAYRQARGLYRELEADTSEAKVTGAIGVMHYLRSENDAALRAFQEAATMARAAGADAHEARLLNNMGVIERRLGRFDSAAVHIRQSLQFHRARADRERVAQALNNLANIEEERGRFDQAFTHYREALSIARALDLEDDIPSYLNNLGLVLKSQGRYEEALRYHRAALKKHRTLDTTRGVGPALNNIGTVLEAQGRYEEALRMYRKGLEVYRKQKNRQGIAGALNNIGLVSHHQGRDEKALEVLREAMRINRDVGDRSGLANSLGKMATVYRERGEHSVALEHYQRALRINRAVGRTGHKAAALYGMGLTHLDREQYAAADSVLRASIAITDTLLQTASGTDRRDFLAKEVGRFHTLVTVLVRAGRPEAALRVYERSRARLLAERLQTPARDSLRTVPPVDSLQAALAPDEAAVLYANTDTERPVVAFIVTRTTVRARELSTTSILQRADRRYAAALAELRAREGESWGASRPSLLRAAKGLRTGGDAGPSLSNLVRLYRHELSVPRPARVLSPERRKTLGQYLYSALLNPIKDDLAAASELVVVPDGALSYLPFEALSDWGGTRVVERRRVRYVQSLRVQHLLRAREQARRDERARPLLALGGVVYDPATYAADTAGVSSGTGLLATRSTEGGEVTASPPDSAVLSSALRGERSPRSAYQALGYGPERWSNLRGTLTEVQGLRRAVGGGTLLIGREASEHTLRQMSTAGHLDDYRALHFATHGFAVATEPSLSALVLSEVGQQGRTGASSGAERSSHTDGYLTMREISSLRLNAEFVALSACQTGLGRIYRGSGAVSLTHAFLQAGATSVAVSLWSVTDASSRRFMEAVYRRAWEPETSWSEALARTKRAFIRGDHGRRFQDPRYWAPFVYYGWEGAPVASR